MSNSQRILDNNTDLQSILTELGELTYPPEPAPPPLYQTREVTENGVYVADAGYDAIRQITVNVQSGTVLPELSNAGTAEDIIQGKEFIDENGNKIVGTFSLEAELAQQNALIEQLRTALEEKGAGGTAYREQLDLMINRDIVSAVVPEGIKKIGNYTYCDCRKLVDVSIPETVTTIAYRSFYSCTALETITLPASLKTMNGGQTFASSTKLTTVRLLGATPPSIATNTFPDNVVSFIVPKGAKSAYDAASNWSALASKITEEA